MQKTADIGISPLNYHPAYEVLDESETKRRGNLQYTLRKISETNDRHSVYSTRSVHTSSHGLIYGEMEIYDNLPEQLAQGMFAQPKKLPLVMRFSTVPGDILNDKLCTPRSLAIKILGVEGERLSGSEEATTQNFLFVNGSSFLSSSVQHFLSNLKILATTDNSPEFKEFLAQILQSTSKLIDSLSGGRQRLLNCEGQPETNILGETYFSQDPILYGNYMAKVALVPVAPALLALTNKPVDISFASDSLKKSVVDFFITNTAVWELRVQLCTDINKMPIEDATVIWSEEDSPYLPIARITAKPQIAWSPYRSKVVDSGMMFSPWHGIKSHRPLGSVTRLRKMTYEMSKSASSIPGAKTISEPTNLDDLC
ncbi:catalase family protein [Methylophilus sp. Leaf414]|uniref:catalase family protein n=1 Tax=Methylophilus sp. Leaf414 TaxID=1736371 RepID=UPI0006F995B0|nr:catalase family protein [Methylophilus sp. Leaf414]KQT36563.1 catalase [Methylophilus sp. Leaf414]